MAGPHPSMSIPLHRLTSVRLPTAIAGVGGELPSKIVVPELSRLVNSRGCRRRIHPPILLADHHASFNPSGTNSVLFEHGPETKSIQVLRSLRPYGGALEPGQGGHGEEPVRGIKLLFTHKPSRPQKPPPSTNVCFLYAATIPTWHLKNPKLSDRHYTVIMSAGIVTLLEIQLAHDMVHLHEFLLELMYSAQMVVQTILRLSPSRSLTPQKNSSSTVVRASLF